MTLTLSLTLTRSALSEEVESLKSQLAAREEAYEKEKQKALEILKVERVLALT